jgi:hypothetical protein
VSKASMYEMNETDLTDDKLDHSHSASLGLNLDNGLRKD